MASTIRRSPLSVAAEFGFHVQWADSDPDEHLLMSVVATRWAPHIGIDYSHDGAAMLLKLALANTARELPSVIVLNRHMDRYDGLRTLCELQSHLVLWQIPVVMLLDRPDIRAEIDSYRAGARWVQRKAETVEEMREFLQRLETFAASSLAYQPVGCEEVSLMNHECALEAERTIERSARARRSGKSKARFSDAT